MLHVTGQAPSAVLANQLKYGPLARSVVMMDSCHSHKAVETFVSSAQVTVITDDIVFLLN